MSMAQAEAVGLSAAETRAPAPTQPTQSPASNESADRFFSLSLDLFSMGGRNGYFQRLNPAFARAFGYTRAELLGLPFLAFVHPDDREATQAELDKLAHGQPTLGFEYRFRHKDGTYRWLAWTAVPTPEGVVHAAVRDITERRLENKPPAEREQADGGAQPARNDEFLVAVSHDLQQPLTLIKGQVQLLQRRLARGEPVDQALLERSLAYVNAAGMRMRTMLNALLETALEQAGQPQTLLLSATDVVGLTRQAVDEHQLAFDLYQFTFETEAPSVVAVIDAARVQRTIENLLSNAVKYSSEGQRIRVSLWTTHAAEPRVLIAVRDAGLGIPADDLPHIFDRFYRGANVVGRIAGNGLGMAAARQTIELHGGSISVESVEGAGSTFTISLPLG
jgi:PAS domain S-box-containing protein